MPTITNTNKNSLPAPLQTSKNDKPYTRQKAAIPVNISETDKEYILSLATPGSKRENFTIEIIGKNIIITVHQNHISPECIHERWEYDYENWKRVFRLPMDADAFFARAKYRDGELIIRIPKGLGDCFLKETLTIYVY